MRDLTLHGACPTSLSRTPVSCIIGVRKTLLGSLPAFLTFHQETPNAKYFLAFAPAFTISFQFLFFRKVYFNVDQKPCSEPWVTAQEFGSAGSAGQVPELVPGWKVQGRGCQLAGCGPSPVPPEPPTPGWQPLGPV